VQSYSIKTKRVHLARKFGLSDNSMAAFEDQRSSRATWRRSSSRAPTNHDRTAYEADLGSDTQRIAETMQSFDLGQRWIKVAAD
jgi:Protein of unknown function (DUF2950)